MLDEAVTIPNATGNICFSTTSDIEGYKVPIDIDLYIPNKMITGQYNHPEHISPS